MKKIAVFSLGSILLTAAAFLVLIMLFFCIAFLLRVSVPENPRKVGDNICIHFEGGRGSGEEVLIFSYYCDSAPNWETVMYPSMELLHGEEECYNGESWDISDCAMPRIWKKQGILDEVDTMECPLIKVKNNIIEVKQNKLCDCLAHDYPEPEYLQFSVDEKGKFISGDNGTSST